MLAALNTCGYDQDLTISDVARSKVRAEVQKNLLGSEEAEAARTALCQFYQGHMASNDANRNLSQYISLALSITASFYVGGCHNLEFLASCRLLPQLPVGRQARRGRSGF